jgi:hypothetical protein
MKRNRKKERSEMRINTQGEFVFTRKHVDPEPKNGNWSKEEKTHE